jgi:predicted AAA+ superfamily ATPase
MAISNHARVGNTLELLREGLQPFVEREMSAKKGKYWITKVTETWRHELNWPEGEELPHLDVAAILRLMWEQWNDVFRVTLGHAERSLVSELREFRNSWAHQETFSGDDTYRTLDSAARLLTAVSAPQADEVEKMKQELLRVRFDEQARHERRKTSESAIQSDAVTGLKPWREVVTPHRDVASGRYTQAEFAADLWQVHIGEGSPEYRDPVEFFQRTYLTESLTRMLIGAARRLNGQAGDPVVQLQTKFGGGKTHSMLALYHLFSGTPSTELVGIEAVLQDAEVSELARVNRVVLVGNKISPGSPAVKADGTRICTLWGEMAWQLGLAAGGIEEARKAFSRVHADDEKGTSPGDTLRELMNDYGPCLILIDEWVAYARQLHDEDILPAGRFETHFTFAQALTESAKLAKNCLLVISLPASDTAGSPHAVADDVEVGGERGRTALNRLRNAVGRVEASWRPASAEEGFEIVRRRLFEPLVEKEQFIARDTVARSFFDLYRTQKQEFPTECGQPDYEKRIKAAYPIHPEVFDRLYTDWSTLIKFQRTRGVLRLMAAVIHSLWDKGDRSPLILPANIHIDDQRVQFELTRYLSDNWPPVIDKDVDGPNSLPVSIDSEVPNLGKYHACRRVARTIYLGSAPTANAANRGIEDRRINLGCVMPGESPAIFGDALRRLSSAATFLYQDGTRYWYSTQATVTKLAEDRAELLRRESDKVTQEMERRLRADLRQAGDFAGVHPFPQSGQDVPDEQEARLVVLSTEHSYSKDAGNRAKAAAMAIYANRGNTPRLFRNTLSFLAVDESRLQDLDEAVRRYLAWASILSEKDELDLSPYQMKQAEAQRSAADNTVNARLPEAYQWLLVPVQLSPQDEVEWQAFRLSGSDALAVRACKKLIKDELLITGFAATRLRMELDRVPLWRGDHVEVKQLVEDFARYPYLPRLKSPIVLLAAVEEGVGLMMWEQDSFAYADSYDEGAGRYRGLRSGKLTSLVAGSQSGLLVKPEIAKAQQNVEVPPQDVEYPPGDDHPGGSPGGEPGPQPLEPQARPTTRFHGSVNLDPTRAGRDAGTVAAEVISHLAGLVGAQVEITMEIQVHVPAGISDKIVRDVTENCNTLKFDSHGFEEE